MLRILAQHCLISCKKDPAQTYGNYEGGGCAGWRKSDVVFGLVGRSEQRIECLDRLVVEVRAFV
jgi:hypothetical protein